MLFRFVARLVPEIQRAGGAMHLEFMRSIDTYVGSACLLVVRVLWRMFDGARARNTHPDSISTVMFQKFFGIGSIVNALPTLRRFRRQYPDAHFVFVTFPAQEEIVRLSGLADDVRVIDNRNLARLVLSTLATLRALTRRGVDMSVDLEFFTRFPMLLACLSGAAVRVGFDSRQDATRRALLTHPTSFNNHAHIARNYLAMAEAVGMDCSGEDLDIGLPSVGAGRPETVHRFLGDDRRQPLATLVAGVSELCTLRAWPTTHFAELIRRMESQWPDTVFALIGTAEQRPRIDDVIRLAGGDAPHLLNLAGRTSFLEAVALIEASSVVISNDGGPAHIAAAHDVPVVVMYGPETPVIYRPLSDKAHVFYEPPFCSPCLNALENKAHVFCPHTQCMYNITVDAVFSAVSEVLGTSGPGHGLRVA